MFKPITRLARGAISSSIYKANSSLMMGPAVLLTTMSKRTAVGTTKGAPPISIDDLYGLCFLCEPKIRPEVERPPQEMFDIDIRINEVVIYVNGGLHATKDKVSEDFVRHMFEANVIFFPRDASNKPQEFRDILKSQGGTEELPQLWVQGKCVGYGSELNNFDRVWELCAPARRDWPRDGSYQKGFYNKPGVTQSDQVIGPN